MKHNKLLAVFAMLLVGLSFIPATTAAEKQISVDNIDIYRVRINDDDLNLNPSITTPALGPFFPGEKVYIKAYWGVLSPQGDTLTGSLDARIKVELDDEDYETDYFTVKQGWLDSESFTFQLPEDLDEGKYVLQVEIEDDSGRSKHFDGITLNVVNNKHFVELYDVNFPQGLEVKAGQTFVTSVGVKNLGQDEEEDIRVSVSIPELGLYQRSNRFDLLTEEQEDNSNDDDDEWKLYKDLFLVVPTDVTSGVYDLIVNVEYDDGDKEQEERYSLVVGSGASPSGISIDTTSQTFAQGSGAVYTVMFSGDNDYTINVEGVSEWGTYSVDKQGNTANVFVKANEDTATGNYPFNVKVMSGNAEVKEFDLTAKITSFGPSGDIREGLQIGFAVLLVILIILGIILAARKIGKSDEYEDSLDEGETYY